MAPARTGDTIIVVGLDKVVRDFRRIDKSLARSVQGELRKVAEPVAQKARSIATSKGLVDSGNLVGKIRPFATRGGAGIRESATARPSDGRRGGKTAGKPYSYPRKYEFGDRGEGESVGPRAFMFPAAEGSADMVRDDVDKMLGRLFDGGFGRL